MNFATRQSLKIFILGLVFLIIAIALFYQLNYNSALNFQLEASKIIVNEISKDIDQYLIDKVTNTKTIATTPAIITALSTSNDHYQSLSETERNEEISLKNNQWKTTKDHNNSFILDYTNNEVAKYFKSLQQNIEGEYGEIFLTNKFGALVASTAKLTTFAHGHKYWWQGAFNNGKGTIFLDDRGYDDSVGGYVLGVVFPIKKEDEIIGILKVNLNILGSINTIIVNSQIKNHKKLKLVRSGGLIVFEEGLEPLNQRISNDLQQIIQTKSNDSFVFESKEDKCIVGLAEIKITSEIDGINFGGSFESIDHKKGNSEESWLILDFNPFSNVVDKTTIVVTKLWLIGIIFTIIFAIMSFFMGKRIAKPIKKLIKQAEQISKGDFNAKISVERGDEIGLLAAAFNQMATYLKKSTTSIAKLNAIFNTAADGMQIIGTDYKIKEVNDTFLNLVGLSRKDVIGKNCYDIFYGKYCRTQDCPLKILQQNKDAKLEYEIIKKRLDGTEIPTIKTVTSLTDEQGNLIGIIEDFKDMTEYKQAEEKLKTAKQKAEENENKLLVAQEISHVGSWEYIIDTDTVTWSKELFNIYERSYDLPAPKFSEQRYFYTAESFAILEKAVQDCVQHEIPYGIELDIITSSGTVKHIISKGNVKKDKNGKIIGTYGTAQDITQKKKTEQELIKTKEQIEKSEARLRDAQRIAKLGNWLLDLQTGKVELSDEMLNFYGFKDKIEDLNISEFEKFYTPESWQRFNEATEKIINTGKSEKFEMEFSDKNAKYRYVLGRGEAIYNEYNKIIALKGTLQDITKSKQAEKNIIALKKRNQALLDHSPVCHKIVDLDFNLQYMSSNGFKMLKLEENDEVYGQPYPFVFFPASFRKQMLKKMKWVKVTGDTLTFEDVTKDIEGNEVWLNSTIVPVMEDGKIEYLTVVSADTTQQKRDEIDKRRLERKLIQSQKSEAIGNLAGGIAHDFNNLLTPIIGMSELLLRDLPKNSLEYEDISEILKAGIRGSELVKQILAFSRQKEHKMVPTRIHTIIKEVLKLSRSTIPAYIEIIEEIQSDCGLALADAIQIHQIAMNIITNAYHAVEEANGNKITVKLKEANLREADLSGIRLKPGRYAILSVSDTGNGIPPDIMDKIFDPYFTTKKQGKGTGLGLAVVYGIIKEHKGDIKIYTEIGIGTTFNVYLPLMDKIDKSDEKEVIEVLPEGDERILLVDDDPAIVKLVSRMLQPQGYSITKFTNSIEALHAFEASPDSFDIIVSDMNMPNMAGDKLASAIKSIRSDIPYILCTGFSERINTTTANVLGISDILMKPVLQSELVKKVRKLLDETKEKNQ